MTALIVSDLRLPGFRVSVLHNLGVGLSESGIRVVDHSWMLFESPVEWEQGWWRNNVSAHEGAIRQSNSHNSKFSGGPCVVFEPLFEYLARNFFAVRVSCEFSSNGC